MFIVWIPRGVKRAVGLEDAISYPRASPITFHSHSVTWQVVIISILAEHVKKRIRLYILNNEAVNIISILPFILFGTYWAQSQILNLATYNVNQFIDLTMQQQNNARK